MAIALQGSILELKGDIARKFLKDLENPKNDENFLMECKEAAQKLLKGDIFEQNGKNDYSINKKN